APPRATWSCAASRSRRATRSSCGSPRATATRRSSPTPTASTSPARPTTTSRSARAAPTSAWATPWPAWRSASCSRSCCRGWPTSGSRGTSGGSAPTSSTASRRCRSPSRSPEACLWRGGLGGRRATGGGRDFRRRSVRAAGDRRPGPVAVVLDGDAPVVAVAVGRGGQHLGARPGGADVPGGDDLRGGRDVHRHGPVVRAGHRDVEVVAVAPLLPGGQRRGAAVVAAATAATATAAASAAGAADRDVGAAAALVTLGRHDLVVVVAEVHPVPGPRVEVVAGGDGAAGPPLLPDAPELREGRGALDGRLVVPHRPVDVVGAAVAGDRA